MTVEEVLVVSGPIGMFRIPTRRFKVCPFPSISHRLLSNIRVDVRTILHNSNAKLEHALVISPTQATFGAVCLLVTTSLLAPVRKWPDHMYRECRKVT